jgi:hypothetical protein
MRILSSPPLLALLLTGAIALPTLASDSVLLGFEGSPGADGVPPPWRFERWAPMVGLGEYTAEASAVQPSGPGAPTGKVLKLECRDAGFLVGSERAVDITQQRIATWSWRAEVLPTGASFRARETNDQVLQLLFGFENGEVLAYIWDSAGPVGASGSGLTWKGDTRVIVLQAGPDSTGRWVQERRDLVQDFERLFGHPPPSPIQGVAIQSNCQHTESSGLGYIGAVRLSTE